MKALLVFEARQGQLLDSAPELLEFASRLEAETVGVLPGDAAALPPLAGRLFCARLGDGLVDAHCAAILAAVAKENPDLLVFPHSSYGWDLAPRVAARLGIPLFSEVVALAESGFELACCNGKMRRRAQAQGTRCAVTLQAGAFSGTSKVGTPQVESIEVEVASSAEFLGYSAAEAKAVDLTRAEVIVSAGRGIGRKDNLPMIEALAKALGGELGATRPVVDAGWVEHSRQVGTTGQTVGPKLYVACGISGAIQHVAGMKKSDFVVAINKDRDAPIVEVADVLVVADLTQFVPALTSRLSK